MNEFSSKYRLYGRNKGRKKIDIKNVNLVKKNILNIDKDFKKNKKIILDIGSGYGESSIFLAKNNSNFLVISVERFLDGNINLSKQVIKLKIKNIKIYEGNVIQLLDILKINIHFNSIWILFPDPWPKTKHHKRRLINKNFFIKVYPFLKKNAKIFIATDSKLYLFSILKTIFEVKNKYKWENNNPQNWIYKLQNLPKTKFFDKSEKSERSPFFIKLSKI